jgi:hypothetical protein
MDVNKFWMCDDGMMTYFVAVELAKALNGRLYLSAKPAWRGDKILRNADQNPNRSGAVAVASGAVVGTLKDLVAAVNASTVNAVIALGGHIDVDPSSLTGLGQLPLVLLSSHQTPLAAQASVLLPAATSFETDGSFVNATGKAQGFKRALKPQGDAAPGWELLARLGRSMGLDLAYTRLRRCAPRCWPAKAPSGAPDHPWPRPPTAAPAEPANGPPETRRRGSAMLFWISAFMKIALIVGMLVNMAAILLWVERKQSAMMQDRVGPNRAAIAVAGKRIRARGWCTPSPTASRWCGRRTGSPRRATSSCTASRRSSRSCRRCASSR